MIPTKIAIIGAGSASFGLNTLVSLIKSERLQGSQLVLVDSNQSKLDLMSRFAKKLNQVWDAGLGISCFPGLDPHEKNNGEVHPLDGAEFVILSLEVPPRETLWRSDYEIPLKYGVRQPYAENGGPGGFAHAARNLHPVMQIVRHMEHQCPQALLINFTNPLMRICDAITRYSTIRVVGLCHQIRMGYAMVGKALAGDYHWQVSPKFNSTRATPSLTEIKAQLAHQAMQQFDIYAAGLNHFTWMLGLHDKQSGEDLYPLFFRRWNDLEPSFEPLTRQVYETFDLFPIPGDEHLCEYLPWMDDAQNEPWNKFDLSLYEWDLWAKEREKNEQAIRDYIDGEKDIETLRAVHSEGAVEIIEDLGGTGSRYHLAVNLPNHSYIPNLPQDAIVELPGVTDGNAIHGMQVGALPEPIAELCRREITVTRLCVDAVIRGDQKTALQCLLLDPVIKDMHVAQMILDDYLQTYRQYLPNFWGEVQA